jgi:hypothetical protein
MNRGILRASLVTLSLLFTQHFILAQPDRSAQLKEIKKLLDQYKRPITVLELDAHSGDYSLNIAQNFKAFCVMSDEDTNDKLLEACASKKYANSLMILKKKLTIEELSRLAECEHFDVVLMMHGAEHYSENWESVLNTVLDLGDHTFIQVATPSKLKGSNDLQRKIYQHLKSKNGTLTEIASNSISKQKMALFHFSKPKTFLKRKYWTFKRKANQDDFVIESNFEQKVFHKKKGNKKLPWLPGINLLTFKTLNGSFPTKEKIRDKLAEFKGIKHTDLHIWNVLIQGDTLIPIDGDDKALHYNPKFTLQYIIAQFKRMLTRCGVLNDMDVEEATPLELGQELP